MFKSTEITYKGCLKMCKKSQSVGVTTANINYSFYGIKRYFVHIYLWNKKKQYWWKHILTYLVFASRLDEKQALKSTVWSLNYIFLSSQRFSFFNQTSGNAINLLNIKILNPTIS